MNDRPVTRETLSDGSVAVVEPFAHNGAVISREDGELVWGQAFSMGIVADHLAQIERVLGRMRTQPEKYLSAHRRDLRAKEAQ